MKRQKNLWQTPAVLAVLAVFFAVLFYTDNKYESPPPYGESGVIKISRQDLRRAGPVFLIDGWLLTDGRVTDKPTYIGEFSNLQRGDRLRPPHGKARYRLTLRYSGEPVTVAVDFPELSLWYKILLNETPLASGKGNGHITFLMTPGDHVLTVETLSVSGYYSGMYFPPALGTEETLSRIDNVRILAGALAFLLPLALAAFTFFLWRAGGDLSRCFGRLCCFYALYMFRCFVYLFSLRIVHCWFLLQGLALYGLCYSVVRLTCLACGSGGRAWKYMRGALLLLPAVLTVLALLIPLFPPAVFLHGRLTDLYYVLTFVCTVFFTAKNTASEEWESRYALAGGAVFGAGLILNLFFANRFEPIRFFWQFEWCGLFLVLLFGAMMAARNRRILRENDALTHHLEEQVKKRTEEAALLYEERRAFFSDMAHDLKAPVFATQSFIEAIRRRAGADTKLRGYLDQAEARQREMARRLQGLSALNALDRIKEERVKISVSQFLSELYEFHHGETEVQAVYFAVEPPGRELFLSAQPEKLHLLFENLIYNALKATPRGGSITVSAEQEGGRVRIAVEDTGCGIAPEELPHIFERFYVGEKNRESGTGLGLYIVRSIVTEMGGTIDVCSAAGEGTKFVMEFPPAD